jgi:succinate dehydrogenase / fumarate reductase cytochrome b subunit
MSTFKSVIWSSVGKKFISGATGLALSIFIVIHLAGNMLLFVGEEVFNAYAHFLESLVHGWFIYVFEAGLLAILLLHIISGVAVLLDKWRARPTGYRVTGNAGGPSKKTISSRTMIITGLIILVFLPIHVIMFKFGATETVEAEGAMVRNLFGLVAVDFIDPLIAFGYAAVMIVLGFHLRHGIWSAFQSLGLTNDNLMPKFTAASVVLGVVLAAGFLILPLYFYFVH